MRPIGSPEALERRRHRAVSLWQKGVGPGDIAHRLGVDRRSVHRWIAAYQEEGDDGLVAVPASGRPRKLTDEEREELTEMLMAGAKAFGYSNDLWTAPRVADLIRKQFRVRYHRNHVPRLLRSLGFSPQKPTRKARERDEARIQGWVHHHWPKVKKTPGG